MIPTKIIKIFWPEKFIFLVLSHQQGRRNRGEGCDCTPRYCRSINPISVTGADYAHHINTPPSRFSDLPTTLICDHSVKSIFQSSLVYAFSRSFQHLNLFQNKLSLAIYIGKIKIKCPSENSDFINFFSLCQPE